MKYEQSKDLTDLPRTGRPRVTSTKRDEQIVALADQQTFATSHDIKEDLDSEDVKINERTIRLRLNEAGAKFKI